MGICSVGHVAVWRCFDYEKFGIPAAKVTGISTIEDLLKGSVSAATPAAVLRGVNPGMSGEEAVRILSRS